MGNPTKLVTALRVDATTGNETYTIFSDSSHFNWVVYCSLHLPRFRETSKSSLDEWYVGWGGVREVVLEVPRSFPYLSLTKKEIKNHVSSNCSASW